MPPRLTQGCSGSATRISASSRTSDPGLASGLPDDVDLAGEDQRARLLARFRDTTRDEQGVKARSGRAVHDRRSTTQRAIAARCV